MACPGLTLVLDPQGSWTRRELMCCGYEDLGGYVLHCGYALWIQVQVLLFACVWSRARNGSLSEPQLPNREYRAVFTFWVVSYPWVNNNSVRKAAGHRLFIFTALPMSLSAFEFKGMAARDGLEPKLQHPRQWFSQQAAGTARIN